MLKNRSLLLLFLILISTSTNAAPATPIPTTSPLADDEVPQNFEPKPLDGIQIEAIESYPNPKDHELGIGLGIYPFNPYYTGFLINANYLYNFSRVMSWEILNVSYAYSIQNDLTTELADKYNVNPKRIQRLEFLLGSNLQHTFLNGKFVFLKKHIRYFKGTGLLGAGLAKTNEANNITANYGLRFEFYTSESFSWRLDVRNQMTFSDITNYVTFTLGMGFGL